MQESRQRIALGSERIKHLSATRHKWEDHLAHAQASGAVCATRESSQAVAHASCVEAQEEHCNKLLSAWRKQTKAMQAMPASHLDAERRQALQQRKCMISTSNERLQILQDAMTLLQADMAASREAVISINDAVFAHAAAAFSSAMAAALPTFQFRVQAVGASASDGVQVSFCKVEAESSQDKAWSTNLGELSGGQRSLCALAFLLAASTAGIAPSVLLVDEVDAALDDVNQTRVGEMLQQCSQQFSCQVWAVSHSTVFHSWCSTFIKVTRSPTGTAAEIVQADAGFAAPPAHAPAARTKRMSLHAKQGGRQGGKARKTGA